MPPPDSELRRRLFWCVLTIACMGVAASHGLSTALRYPLEPGEPLVYGGFGLSLATPTAPQTTPRVVLLGNSVYQGEDVPALMGELATIRQRPLELVNLAQVGSGFEDYLVQAAWSADQPRDLTVVCLGYVTIASGPRFRTDARRHAFSGAALRRLPASFYLRNFSASEAAAGVSATLLPHQRVDPILRHALRRSSLARPGFLYDQLQFPTLNLTRNRIVSDLVRGRSRGFDWWNREPDPHWEQACEELLELLSRLGPALVVVQEARPSPHGDQAITTLAERCRAHGVGFADLRAAWSPATFRDPIHPTPAERPRQAQRHLAMIERALGRDDD